MLYSRTLLYQLMLVSAPTAIALREVKHSLIEMFRRELRPEYWRDKYLSVGRLPEQIVAQAHFATGATQ
jgi:hypothetical protein